MIFLPLLALLPLGMHAEPTQVKAKSQVEAESQAKLMTRSRNYKKAIKAYLELSQTVPENEKGMILALLAENYYKDQEQEKAFRTYLSALDAAVISAKEPEITEDEQVLYKEALAIYLDPSVRDSKQIALKIRDLYGGIWRLHPEYAHIGYLVAISYANLGEYPEFFDIFYQSYIKAKEHFLAYKTKGILYTKLFDRAKTVEQKDQLRKKGLISLQKAKELFPQDPTLYKMEIAFSFDKEEVLISNLKEIMSKDIVIPRSDLSFYIDQLFSFGKTELALQFIEKAEKWHPYSRTLDSAKEMVQEKMGNRGSDGARSSR